MDKAKDATMRLQQQPSVPTTRKRTQCGDAANAARGRASKIIDQHFKPGGWTEDEAAWVLAKIANKLNITGGDIAARIGRQKKKTELGTEALRTQRYKMQAAVDQIGFAALTEYLQHLPPTQLAEYIPPETRQLLIRGWVEKVQEFWSLRRCAYLKSVTLTSNSNWGWFRSLLGREVVDGQWVNKVIDGYILSSLSVHTITSMRFEYCAVCRFLNVVCVLYTEVEMPLIWGRWSLDKDRFASFSGYGGTVTHNGLAVHMDALQMVKRLFERDLQQNPMLHTLTLKIGIDAANGHKGQSLTCLGIASNPVHKVLMDGWMHEWMDEWILLCLGA